MKYSTLTALLVLAMAATGFCQEDTARKNAQMQIDQYWFVMLTKGTNRIQDSVKAAEIQKGHLANITRLYNEGYIYFRCEGRRMRILNMGSQLETRCWILDTERRVNPTFIGYC